MIAFCGLICTECPAYLATREDSDEKRKSVAALWSEQFKSGIKPEEINCDGCLSGGGRLFSHCHVCEIRKCGQEKQIENCAYCDDYPCRKVRFVVDVIPEARDTLATIRKLINRQVIFMASRLLKPIRIQNMQLNNRLVMPPMATAKALLDGRVSPEMLAYYKEKAAGGYIGLVIIEHSYVSPEGKAHEHQLSVADDSVIDGLKELAEVIHSQGPKTIMQINHAGSAASADITGVTPLAPSPIDNPRRGSSPRELSKEEISRVVRDFAAAAHGYFLNQFFSPLTNKRHDEYGGEIINRIRIHLETIKAVREVVGPDYPIFVRLGASDYCEGGTTIDDSVVAARDLEAAGLDVLDVSGGFCGYSIPGTSEEGYFAPLAEALKQVVGIPVILTGGIKDAETADRMLQEGKADMIGVGRAILADSLWAKKAIETLKLEDKEHI
jgi:2,4-dienoyl-CoA reductase-like NADH-dependent reductase (Old Yellow Enzyme family)